MDPREASAIALGKKVVLQNGCRIVQERFWCHKIFCKSLFQKYPAEDFENDITFIGDRIFADGISITRITFLLVFSRLLMKRIEADDDKKRHFGAVIGKYLFEKCDNYLQQNEMTWTDIENDIFPTTGNYTILAGSLITMLIIGVVLSSVFRLLCNK